MPLCPCLGDPERTAKRNRAWADELLAKSKRYRDAEDEGVRIMAEAFVTADTDHDGYQPPPC